MTENLRIPAIRADSLQLEEHRAFQEHYWRIQRLAWLGYGVVIFIALLGLTGSGGVLHMQTIRLAGGLAEIPRIARWEAWDDIRITFTGPGDEHRLHIGTDFFDLFEIGRIQPEPKESSLSDQAHLMSFAAQAPPSHEVRISTRPMHFGWTSFTLGLDDERRTVHVLVLP